MFKRRPAHLPRRSAIADPRYPTPANQEAVKEMVSKSIETIKELDESQGAKNMVINTLKKKKEPAAMDVVKELNNQGIKKRTRKFQRDL